MIISNRNFYSSFSSLSRSLIFLHSIKFKLELTSINILLLIHTLLLFSSSPFAFSLSITRQIKHFLSLSLRRKYDDISVCVCKSRANISLLYTDTHQRFSRTRIGLFICGTHTPFSTQRDIISTSLDVLSRFSSFFFFGSLYSRRYFHHF